MSLSENRRGSIDGISDFLRMSGTGDWHVETNLDESGPSSEVTLSNGEKSAIVEFIDLSADLMNGEYKELIMPNQKFLVPSGGGSYRIHVPGDLQLPMAWELRHYLQDEMAREAPSSISEAGALTIPRSAWIRRTPPNGPPSMACEHNQPEIFEPILDRLQGWWDLIDGSVEHSFITSECKEAFHQNLIDACESRLRANAEPIPLEWDEEWNLERFEGEEDGVWFPHVDPIDVKLARAECVYGIADKALTRTAVQRQADYQIIVLEAHSLGMARAVFDVVYRMMRDRGNIRSDGKRFQKIVLLYGNATFDCCPYRHWPLEPCPLGRGFAFCDNC